MDLQRFPISELAFLPTPLMPMHRFAAALGSAMPQLYIKRDDCTGLAQGGNKTRKLEFLLGDAISRGADSIITVGAVQSNHVRQTAAACAAKGLSCDAVLSASVPRHLEAYQHNGNVLLDGFLGAHIHRVANADAAQQKVAELVAQKAQQGLTPYVIPTGGSNAIGALGYAKALQEVVQQCQAINATGTTYLIHASASGGTQAGLVAGNAMLGNPVKVIGVNVYKVDINDMTSHIAQLVDDMQRSLSLNFTAAPDITLWHGFQGSAYGIPTDEGNAAVKRLAQSEGILADPVYSGKALSGLIAQCQRGFFKPDDTVIFLHTGGATALHAYPDVL